MKLNSAPAKQKKMPCLHYKDQYVNVVSGRNSFNSEHPAKHIKHTIWTRSKVTEFEQVVHIISTVLKKTEMR
jgi:hypothetical protein